MNRAYSVLEIRAATESGGKRTFTGIATTPSTDRVGDIVEPKGAEFVLPIPLLWQHNAREPIGWVTAASVKDNGITVSGEVASVDMPGKLKDRLDEAWQMLVAKLVRGLSIGFKEIEAARIADTYSYRYLKWQWLELSAVTIPANADCSITSIKSADRAVRAALGPRSVVRLDPVPAHAGTQLPGASGPNTTQRRKGCVYL